MHRPLARCGQRGVRRRRAAPGGRGLDGADPPARAVQASHRRVRQRGGDGLGADGLSLQPHRHQPATPPTPACNPTRSSLQPHSQQPASVLARAAPGADGCGRRGHQQGRRRRLLPRVLVASVLRQLAPGRARGRAPCAPAQRQRGRHQPTPGRRQGASPRALRRALHSPLHSASHSASCITPSTSQHSLSRRAPGRLVSKAHGPRRSVQPSLLVP